MTTRNSSSAGADAAVITASRSSWSGQMLVGPHVLLVKAYSAAVTSTPALLHQVHQTCGERIQYRKHCPVHGEVGEEQIAKAFCFAPSDQLELTADELARLGCEDDKSIRIEHLLPGSQLDLALLSGRSLHLVPTHAAAENNYSLLIQTLGTNTWAIGRAIFSDHRQPVAIHVTGGRLLLHVLHWPQQRRACPPFGQSMTPAGRAAVRDFERPLVKLRRAFSWEEYTDEYPPQLAALVQEKVATRTTPELVATGTRRAKQRSNKSPATSRRARAA
jgi:DNA end-binding protein Ku